MVGALRDDAHITLENFLEYVCALMHSIKQGAHVSSNQDLIVKQLKEEFWRMSDAKMKVMAPGCGCGRCTVEDTAWQSRCHSRHRERQHGYSPY